MIPSLLHGRLLGEGPAGGILASPSYLPRLALKGGATSATATATFSINPDGTWGSTGSGYTEESGNWFLPMTVGAGNAYDVRVTLTLLSGGGAVVTNAASNWIAASAQRTIEAMVQRFTDGVSVASYRVLVEFRPTGGGATVSSGSFNMDVEADVGGAVGSGCPTIDMVMADGTRAEFVKAGDLHLVCDPDTGEEVLAEVDYADTRQLPCLELVSRSGARFKCSITAPMATGAGEVKAPNLLGYDAWLKVSGVRCLQEVVQINDIGLQLVRYIVIKPVRHPNDRYFWVGGVDGVLWLHHNSKIGNDNTNA